jgi:hypothetical protein
MDKFNKEEAYLHFEIGSLESKLNKAIKADNWKEVDRLSKRLEVMKARLKKAAK